MNDVWPFCRETALRPRSMNMQGTIRRQPDKEIGHVQTRPKKVPKIAKAADHAARLRKALAKRRKDELLDALVELAKVSRKTFHLLATRFELKATPDELVEATRHAIFDATDFDERDLNSNFDYDYAAYEEVKSNLGRLVDLGQWQAAMELSLELMKEGSYQVEMSDEGSMTQDIEECLAVVLKSLKKSSLPPNDVIAWCSAMLAADRVGFICDGELKSLRTLFESS